MKKIEIIEKIKKCPDCLARYRNSKTFTHVCPPWMKSLVAMKKARKKYLKS